jgi:hypothetical protein
MTTTFARKNLEATERHSDLTARTCSMQLISIKDAILPSGNAIEAQPTLADIAHRRLPFSEGFFGGSQHESHVSDLATCRPGGWVNQSLLLVTKWGLAMSKDEETSGPGARDFGLVSQVKWMSNEVALSPARGSLGG